MAPPEVFVVSGEVLGPGKAPPRVFSFSICSFIHSFILSFSLNRALGAYRGPDRTRPCLHAAELGDRGHVALAPCGC